MNAAASLILSAILLQAGTTKAARCMKRMSSRSGSFTSPGFPLKYPPSSSCRYVIKAKFDYYIEVTFSEFNLEPPRKGRKTDFITISDGWRGNQQNMVTLDGSAKPPYTFTAVTPRVMVKFVSNKLLEFGGFNATYKFVKREGCSNLEVENSQSKCNVNAKGISRYCAVTCDQNYKLQGKKLSYCRNETFFNPPSCAPDPAFFCNVSKLEEFNPDCLVDQKTDIPTFCLYLCESNYLPVNKGTFSCVGGTWDVPPECVPDPKKMNFCNLEPNSTECPFSREVIAQYELAAETQTDNETDAQLLDLFEEFGDDLRPVVGPPIEPSVGSGVWFSRSFIAPTSRSRAKKKYQCPSFLCLYIREKSRFKYDCKVVAKVLKRKKKLSDAKAQQRMVHCYKCQNNGCSPTSLFS